MLGNKGVEHVLKRLADLEERVARLEGLAPESGASGGSEPARSDGMEPSGYVLELVALGKTVQAIDQYRKDTGLGLKEAKRRIDELS